MKTLPRLLLSCVLLAVLPAITRAVEVTLLSDPAGASVRILNPESTPQKGKPSQWTTPAKAEIAKNRSGETYTLEFSRPGFETVRVSLDLRSKPAPVNVTLAPLVQSREFSFTTNPAGAKVLLSGKTLGTTPLQTRLEFQRSDSRSPWSTAEVRLELPDHQTETVVVGLEKGNAAVSVELARLREEREFAIAARNADQQAVDRATIEVQDEKVAETPAKIRLEFKRATKMSEWPQFKVAVYVTDEYQRVERTLTVSSPGGLNVELTPVTEMNVIRYAPTLEMTGRGPRITIDKTATLGTAVNDRDENSPAERTIRITNFERKQPGLQALNSFAVTPDGQNIVYAVLGQSEDGRYYSNLFMRSANPSNASVVRLTSGPRYLDCFPSMSREEGSSLVVFQSNRSGIDSFDISSFRIQDGRLVGGIQQLTREARFNTEPSFASEARPIFFTSLEEFPQAKPQIASVRVDGSAYTNLGEVGEGLSYAENGRIYFSRLTEDTKRHQLYSILADGTGIETILNDFNFAQANCHSPSLSPDGHWLLFVSDFNPDRAARKDNNIWVLDLEGTRQPLQITTNTSDDIRPVWSPTEPEVIYFMSNRRGAYNVWQMSVKLAR